jgi:hypothetical protein
MRKTCTKEINGFTYSTTQLGATEGRKVGTRLMRVVGAAAESSEPLAALMKAITDEDYLFLVKTFGAISTVSGGEFGERAPFIKDVAEEHFAGHMGSELAWLAWCLEVNFADFLSELGVNADLMKMAKEMKLPIPSKAAIGPSGV